MNLEKIVVMASRKVDLQLRVFLRSLRATGCDLPVWIIPYGDRDFDAPADCRWIERPALFSFLQARAAHPLYSKYAALLEKNSAYFDTDIVMLENPSKWLARAPSNAFVVADTEWAKNRWTFSEDSKAFLVALSSLWPLWTFNSGFFAFEAPLYGESELIETVGHEEMRRTCLKRKKSPVDQPAINWLVLRKHLRVFNFALPPQCMESTLAVDYGQEDPGRFLARSNAPVFLHYAGPVFAAGLPSTSLYTSFLTKCERVIWDAEILQQRRQSQWLRKWPWGVRLLNFFVRIIDPRFYVQPRP